MERIAVYGKGGVGKSVVATSLSAVYARQGRRVLHVGCDPKADSAVRLLEGGGRLPTVLETLAGEPNLASADRFLHVGRLGITCCEAGGPPPGVGCGGRGVARTLELLDELDVLERGGYDVVIFDVLGDVVCGGFAAPLRQGFAERVLIVVSEEPMALFAANNISRAIDTYHDNGVWLGGFVANLKTADADRDPLERFATRLSSRLLTSVPRDPMVQAAERERRTVIEYAPESPATLALTALAAQLLTVKAGDVSVPTPLGDDEFFAFIKD
jgi:nitrogenase iron protein NifH